MRAHDPESFDNIFIHKKALEKKIDSVGCLLITTTF